MSDLSIRAAGMAASQPNWGQEQSAASEDAAPGSGGENGGTVEEGLIQSMLREQEEQSKSLAEMIDAAQKKAAEQREALKLPKNNTRYGDAPLEAYARLARAKNKAQVNAASGFARRKLFQLKAALHSDSENTPTIRGAINQLQKSINRAERKKRELDREQLLDRRQAKARREKEEQKAKRLRQELQRKRNQRIIRESGYTREAVVSEKIHAQLTQTQMELRQQMQDLSASTGMTLEAVAQQYAAQAAPPEAARRRRDRGIVLTAQGPFGAPFLRPGAVTFVTNAVTFFRDFPCHNGKFLQLCQLKTPPKSKILDKQPEMRYTTPSFQKSYKSYNLLHILYRERKIW